MYDPLWLQILPKLCFAGLKACRRPERDRNAGCDGIVKDDIFLGQSLRHCHANCGRVLRSHTFAGGQDKEGVSERIPYDDPDLLDQLDKAVGGCCVFTLRYLFNSQQLLVD